MKSLVSQLKKGLIPLEMSGELDLERLRENKEDFLSV